MSKVDELIEFWFPQNHSTRDLMKRWFSASESMDRDIQERFGLCLQQAEQNALQDWQDSPKGHLALIILLDQFSRNIYRGSAKAFANDALARQSAKDFIQQKRDQDLDLYWRIFVYLPFEHSENIQDQEESMRLFQELVKIAPDSQKPDFVYFLDYAQQHYDIIKRFDRFPHRNERLNRVSTPDEIAFLKQPGSSFG